MAVPARYVFVWMGDDFHHPARLAVESVLQRIPEATVELHVLGPFPSTAAFAALTSADRHDADRISVAGIDPARLLDRRTAELFDRIPSSALSARSNLLRLALLRERGGVYLDVDTLVLRPIHELAPGAFVGAESVWRHDRARVERGLSVGMLPGATLWGSAWCVRRLDSTLFGGALRTATWTRPIDRFVCTLQANNAVIGVPPNSEFIEYALELAVHADPTVRYALGPSLVDDVARAHPESVTLLSPDVLYPVAPSESHRFFADRHLSVDERAAVLHYVSSNHRDLLRSVMPGDLRFGAQPLFWSHAGVIDAGCRVPEGVTVG